MQPIKQIVEKHNKLLILFSIVWVIQLGINVVILMKLFT